MSENVVLREKLLSEHIHGYGSKVDDLFLGSWAVSRVILGTEKHLDQGSLSWEDQFKIDLAILQTRDRIARFDKHQASNFLTYVILNDPPGWLVNQMGLTELVEEARRCGHVDSDLAFAYTHNINQEKQGCAQQSWPVANEWSGLSLIDGSNDYVQDSRDDQVVRNSFTERLRRLFSCDGDFALPNTTLMNFLEWHNKKLVESQREFEKRLPLLRQAYKDAVQQGLCDGWLPPNALMRMGKIDDVDVYIGDTINTTGAMGEDNKPYGFSGGITHMAENAIELGPCEVIDINNNIDPSRDTVENVRQKSDVIITLFHEYTHVLSSRNASVLYDVLGFRKIQGLSILLCKLRIFNVRFKDFSVVTA